MDNFVWTKNRKDFIKNLPITTGIYYFKNKNTIIYIGKSVNIKARVASHLENARLDYKEAAIVNQSDKIGYIITDSEFKALILESELIQKYRPKYNVLWKDNKSYLYIKITSKDKYPKIYPIRKESDNRSDYFGPFSSTRLVNELIRDLRKIIPFCTQKKLSRHPCFYSKINQCSPCPNFIESLKNAEEKRRLTKLYKKNIDQIKKLLKAKINNVLKDYYLQLKKLINTASYEEAINLRNRIHRLENLNNQRFSNYDLSIQHNLSFEAIESLKGLISKYFSGLKSLERIEGYDISSLSQKDATASMVVLTDGLINRSLYRKFKIKNEKLHSDTDMLVEVFKRRFNQKWQKPDLLVVDGGGPQVRTVQKVLTELKINIPIIGIAKQPDRLVIPENKLIHLKPEANHAGFNLIRMLRDESHRFARKYHLLLRRKNFIKS